jgi:ankyrin repeat domain-containing protein 50
LTVPELIDGIAIELGENAQFNRKRRLCDEKDIREICPGFISVALNTEVSLGIQDGKPSYVVHIAHYSVQEYLESDRIRHQNVALFSMCSTTSDVQIAQMCLVYLLDPVLSKTKATHATLDELPLAKYAAKYWFDHTKGCEISSSRLQSCVTQLYSDRGYAFTNSINIHDHDKQYIRPFAERQQKATSRVYYAALLGFSSVLRELLKVRNEQFSQTANLRRGITKPAGGAVTKFRA